MTHIHIAPELEIKQILDHAISQNFIAFLDIIYENSIGKFDTASIYMIFSKLLANLSVGSIKKFLASTIKVLISKNRTIGQIANQLTDLVTPLVVGPPVNEPAADKTDSESLLAVLFDVISERIEPGQYWETLRKLFLILPRQDAARVAIVLQESLDYKKSLQHNSDIHNNLLIRLFDSTRDDIDQTLLADFNNYYDDQVRQANPTDIRDNQSEPQNVEISSPSPDRRVNFNSAGNADSRPVRQIREELPTAHVEFEAPRRVPREGAVRRNLFDGSHELYLIGKLENFYSMSFDREYCAGNWRYGKRAEELFVENFKFYKKYSKNFFVKSKSYKL